MKWLFMILNVSVWNGLLIDIVVILLVGLFVFLLVRFCGLIFVGDGRKFIIVLRISWIFLFLNVEL